MQGMLWKDKPRKGCFIVKNLSESLFFIW